MKLKKHVNKGVFRKTWVWGRGAGQLTFWTLKPVDPALSRWKTMLTPLPLSGSSCPQAVNHAWPICVIEKGNVSMEKSQIVSGGRI